jgi:pimeloyl-ACP methyl ester carboxylesterase
MTMPEILAQDIGDASIQYLNYPGDGPVIIMLHATGFLPWLWHPIARQLAGKFRVLAPYFCDHRQAEPEEGLEWMQLADDLCRFCKCLEIGKPCLVGHSMGATVMTLAEATHGPVAEKMIIIEPIFLPGDLYKMNMTVEQHPLAAKTIKRKNSWDGEDDARQYLSSRPLFRNWDGEILELYIKYGMVPGETGGLSLACHPRREAALFMGSVKYDPWPLLSKVKCPVLVLEGETSENRHFIDLRKAASSFARGEHRLVKGAGHLVPMEKPVETSEIILEFLLRD